MPRVTQGKRASHGPRVNQAMGASQRIRVNHWSGASLGAAGASRQPPEKAKEKDMKVTRFRMSPLDEMAGEAGFEPALPGPEPGVLPLDYSPATETLESKSSPLPGLLNTVRPLNLPRKRQKIRQLIQSSLPGSSR